MATRTPPPNLAEYWRQLRKPLELELTRGCADSAIVGVGIATYARLWAQRLQGVAEEDARLALSIARGLRDYATMETAERRRRAMAAIDLLQQRETSTPAAPVAKVKPAKPAASVAKRTPRKAEPAAMTLPVGPELLELPIDQLAPRARWPKLLAMKLQLYTVRDLLYHIPRDWVEISRIADLPDGARVAVVATVVDREFDRLRSKQIQQPLYKYILTVTDGSGEAFVTSMTIESERARGGKRIWSPAKLPFTPGQRVFVMGKVERVGKLLDIRMEDIYLLSDAEAVHMHPGARIPIYPLAHGIFQSQVQRAVLRVLAALGTSESANALIDPLPEHIRGQFALLPLVEALDELHRPRTEIRHEQARKRLAFEEFIIPQLIMARRRWEGHHSDGPAFSVQESLPALVAELVQFLPTAAQLRVLGEIEHDLRSPRPMNRLLQGDVGSGKTLVAAGALAFAVRAGYQAAIMAPTEILAEQLYLVLSHLLLPLGFMPVLLTGSITGPERRQALSAFAGTAPIVAVGTHALIQKGVNFGNLGLAIIDEQHRFGVLQRAALRGKGRTPHTLVMTATPIPRTLALSCYGDLDVSLLDELPRGRHPIDTRWLSQTELHEAYTFIREQVLQGRQAYVLCPLVEQSELLQADAATEMAEELRKRVFPELQIGLLHGRMQPEEKDAAMEAFRTGQTPVLVCTTVVEVGVDVPNASVMLIHNAERFGLAQLHQLRGRVGRAEHKSTCLLVTHPRYNPEAEDAEDLPGRKRLRIMLDSQDGFVIADADMQLRGPGEYLGTRQAGLIDFQIGNLLRDGKYLEQAQQAAQAIIGEDPEMKRPVHAELRRRMQRLQTHLDQFRE